MLFRSNTLYMKLQKGEVPGSKPGKRWVLFNDELDKWLEVKRTTGLRLTEWCGRCNPSA